MTTEYRAHAHPHYETGLLVMDLQREVDRLRVDLATLTDLIATYLSPYSEEEQEAALAGIDLLVPARRP